MEMITITFDNIANLNGAIFLNNEFVRGGLSTKKLQVAANQEHEILFIFVGSPGGSVDWKITHKGKVIRERDYRMPNNKRRGFDFTEFTVPEQQNAEGEA